MNIKRFCEALVELEKQGYIECRLGFKDPYFSYYGGLNVRVLREFDKRGKALWREIEDYIKLARA